jgi:bifunctional non-homologous end joining protein LigD
MLAARGEEPFDSPSHLYEVKWDGSRALAFVEGQEVRLQDRFLRDVTALYPELRPIARLVRGGNAVLDGEIVALDEAGRPHFSRLRERLAARDGTEAGSLAERTPVTFEAFDILYWRGRSVMDYSLGRRKSLLRQAVRPSGPLAVPEFVDREGVAFFEAAREHGLEGIIAKERESAYLPGQRSPAWLKLNIYEREQFVIGGFTYGERWASVAKRRHQPFASLLLGLYDGPGNLVYVGEVAGGFTAASVQETVRAMDSLAVRECPFREEPRSQRLMFWCRPELVASVRFGEWTRQGRLRFAVFDGLRPDVPAASCRLEFVRP